MPTMEEVFEVIRSEREYQDALWGDQQSKGLHSVAEFTLFLEDYIQEVRHIQSRNASPTSEELSLPAIRKIAALCVVCMEQNGVAPRDMKDLETAKNRHKGLVK